MAYQRDINPADPASASQPACANLLSKGMYITGTLNPKVEDGRVGDGHCWCSQTQHPLGPDNLLVGRKICVPGRQCYVARL